MERTFTAEQRSISQDSTSMSLLCMLTETPCLWVSLLSPAAALWYWGILVSGRLRLGSSLRMSRLSFRLLLFDVFADLHLVFLFGIFVGNFIFSFLLFSCRQRSRSKYCSTVHDSSTTLVCYCSTQYLGSRAGTSEQSGASSGLNIWRTRHTGTEDLRGATVRETGDTDRTMIGALT